MNEDEQMPNNLFQERQNDMMHSNNFNVEHVKRESQINQRYLEDSREFHCVYLRKDPTIEELEINESNISNKQDSVIYLNKEGFNSLHHKNRSERQGGALNINSRRLSLQSNKSVEGVQKEGKSYLQSSFRVISPFDKGKKSSSQNDSSDTADIFFNGKRKFSKNENSDYQGKENNKEMTENSDDLSNTYVNNSNYSNVYSSLKGDQIKESVPKSPLTCENMNRIMKNTYNQSFISIKSKSNGNILSIIKKSGDELYPLQIFQNKSENKQPSIITGENAMNSNNRNKLTSINHFSKINLIKRFIKKLKSTSSLYNFRRIKEKQLQVIADISYSSDQKKKMLTWLQQVVLLPNETFSLIWEVLEIIFLLFHVIAFGFRFGFDIKLSNLVQIFSVIFYLIDLIVIINTGYYNGLEIISNRTKILKYNASHIALIIISLGALVFSDKGPVQFVFIFRIGQLFRSYHHFEQNFQLRQKYPIIATLIHLCLIIMLLAHYNACGFIFFTKQFSDSNVNWLSGIGIQDSNWQTQYICALYFSFITMVTVGYGDIVPKTIEERVYTIIFVLISAIIFAYVVNTIGSLFQELSRQEDKLNQKKYEILSYIKHKNISHSIQISLIKYLEYTISQHKELNHSIEGEQFIQSIPYQLRIQINQEYYGRILQGIKMFNMNFSKEFISELSVFMKEKTLGPGEEIFKQGKQNDTFYFIIKGEVEFEIELQNKLVVSLGTLYKGDAFNNKGLFVDMNHSKTAKSKQITQIVYLNKSDFIAALKSNKDEYEKYCMIRDKYLQNRQDLGEKCLCCDEFGHFSLNCRLIQYFPQKQSIIGKYQYSAEEMDRKEYKRDSRKKPNSLAFNIHVRQQLRHLRCELTSMFLEQQPQNNLLEFYNYQVEQKISDQQFFRQLPQLIFTEDNQISIKSNQDFNFNFPPECFISYQNNRNQSIQITEENSTFKNSVDSSSSNNNNQGLANKELSPKVALNLKQLIIQEPTLSLYNNTIDHLQCNNTMAAENFQQEAHQNFKQKESSSLNGSHHPTGMSQSVDSHNVSNGSINQSIKTTSSESSNSQQENNLEKKLTQDSFARLSILNNQGNQKRKSLQLQPQQQSLPLPQGGRKRPSKRNGTSFMINKRSSKQFSYENFQQSQICGTTTSSTAYPKGEISQTNALLNQVISLMLRNNINMSDTSCINSFINNHNNNHNSNNNNNLHHITNNHSSNQKNNLQRKSFSLLQGGNCGQSPPFNYSNSFSKLQLPTPINLQTNLIPPNNNNNNYSNNKKFIQLDEFDILSEYKYYFPSMNFSVVMLKYNKYIEKLIRKKRINTCKFSKKLIEH